MYSIPNLCWVYYIQKLLKIDICPHPYFNDTLLSTTCGASIATSAGACICAPVITPIVASVHAYSIAPLSASPLTRVSTYSHGFNRVIDYILLNFTNITHFISLLPFVLYFYL